MFDIIGTLFPMLVVVMLLRVILRIVLHGSSGGQESDEYADDEEQTEIEEEPQPAAAEKPDLAAEFERRLKKTSETLASVKKTEQQQAGANKPRSERQRIHREGEKLAHDKGKVYYDPKGDYSYNEASFNAQAAALRARRAANAKEETRRPRVKLKHVALAQGFIMSQVLDKPRSLKPYGAEEPL